MQNNLISKIIEFEKSNTYIEFEYKGNKYKLFRCEIQEFNECIKGLCYCGIIMINDLLGRKEKIRVVKKIITEISKSRAAGICIDLEGEIYCENK